MKNKTKDTTPYKNGFYYVRQKDSSIYQAIVEILTHEFEDRIFITIHRILPLFDTYKNIFTKDNSHDLIFSDDFQWSNAININA